MSKPCSRLHLSSYKEDSGIFYYFDPFLLEPFGSLPLCVLLFFLQVEAFLHILLNRSPSFVSHPEKLFLNFTPDLLLVALIEFRSSFVAVLPIWKFL